MSKELAPTKDRLPPSSTEGEQCVLGCVITSPADCIDATITVFHGIEEVFFDPRHRVIWPHIIEMQENGVPIDTVTLSQYLKDRNVLEAAGGMAYINSLPDFVPSASNLEYYTQVVWDKYLLRKMIKTCVDISSDAFDYQGEVAEMIDHAEASISKVSRLSDSTEEMQPIKVLVNKAISKIEEFHQNQGKPMGIATGFVDLDRLTNGLQDGDMIVVAARPSVGKTSLAMNIAEHVALDIKAPVGIFSLEMTAESLVLRMLCSRARVNMRKVQDGFLAERDFPKLTGTAGKIAGAPLYIDDSSGISILQLKAKMRRMHQQYGIKLFVIDYLQLLHSTSKRAENRQQEIAEISSGIKSVAKELKVPVIVLAQLNRELEKRGPGEKPRLSDLRESGAIEQDADLVCLLYKKAGKSDEGQEEFEQDAIEIGLFLAKQRNGPVGDVDLTFLKSITRFESAARVEPPAES